MTTVDSENEDLEFMKGFDVIVFGTWDANGRELLSDAAVSRVFGLCDIDINCK